MSNGERDTFKNAESHTQMLMVYDATQRIEKTLLGHIEDQRNSCASREIVCNKKFESLKRKKVIDTILVVGSSMIGGAGAMLAKIVVWK